MLRYAIVEVQSSSEGSSLSSGDKKKRLGNVLMGEKMPFLIVAADLVPALEAKWGVKLSVKKVLSGSDLENCRFFTKYLNSVIFYL